MKRIVISGAVLALAIGGMGVGSAGQPVEKVTGGGQILVANQSAGSTIAFNARKDAAGNADGQIQYVDRTAGTGQNQVVQHGTIDCVNIITPTEDGGTARLGGTYTSKDGVTTRFVLDVTDGGEGSNSDGDFIVIRTGDSADTDGSGTADSADCNDDDELQANTALARGNVQVHKVK